MKVKDIEALYNELQTYTLDLHPDPSVLGAAFLNEQVATCRNFSNAVQRRVLQVSSWQQSLWRSLQAAEAEYEIKSADLLARDERVKAGPSIEDRKAIIAVLLAADKAAIVQLKESVRAAEEVAKVVKLVANSLDKTMSDIRLQKSLLEVDVKLAAGHVDYAPASSKMPAGVGAQAVADDDGYSKTATEVDLGSLENVFREVQASPKNGKAASRAATKRHTEVTEALAAAAATPAPAKPNPLEEPSGDSATEGEEEAPWDAATNAAFAEAIQEQQAADKATPVADKAIDPEQKAISEFLSQDF